MNPSTCPKVFIATVAKVIESIFQKHSKEANIVEKIKEMRFEERKERTKHGKWRENNQIEERKQEG